MKKIIPFLLAALFACNLFAKMQNVDSLANVLKTQKLTAREQIELCEKICTACVYTDFAKTKRYAEQGLSISKKEKNMESIFNFYSYCFLAYDEAKIYDTALMYCKKVLDAAIKSKNQNLISLAYDYYGSIYTVTANYESAIDYFSKAIDVAEKTGNKERRAVSMCNIGSIYRTLNQVDNTVKYLTAAENLAKEINRYDIQAKSSIEMCLLFLNGEKYEQALDYARKTLEICRRYGLKRYELQSLIKHSIIHRHLREYDKAMGYANESLRILEKLNSREYASELLDTWYEMACIYLEQKNYGECELMAMKVWTADSLSFGVDLAKMLAISNIYLGNSDKAVYYIQQCQNLEASRFKKNLQVKTVEIGTKYETETEKIKITSLKTEKRLYLWIVIISIAAAALTSVLLYLRKKHKKQIENAQSVLKNETAMRERLADKLKDETVQREYIANKLKDETVKRERLFEFSQLVLKDETVERVRLSRKLNDDIGNRLTVIKLNLTNTNSHAMVENSFTNSFDTTLKLLDESIDELWRVSSNIMPDLSAGLKTPLEDLCMGIPEVKFWFFGDDSHLDNNLRIIIFRCVSELITCGLKNAHKTDLKIQLSVDKEFVLLSAQSGGYSSENLTESEELKDILKRIVIYNGELNVYSSEIEDAKTEPETEITITIEQL